jgi:glycosyltransferase involved in cell wall biosynthesis
MKIGLIATGIWGSIHLEMARALQGRGHAIRIYTEDDRAPSGMRFTRFAEDGIEFWVIHSVRRNPWTWLPDRLFKFWLGRRFFTSLLAIARFVRANVDCDVFVVESDWLGFFVALATLGRPQLRWVVGVHDTDYLDAPIHYPGRPHSRWRTTVQRWTLRRAAALRANSHFTRDALVAGGCSPEKITVVPLHATARMHPPADRPLAEFRAAARREWRKRCGIPETGLMLATLCRLTPVKRLELAVDALVELRRRGVDAWLVLFGGDRRLPGSGSYAAQLARRAADGGAAERLVVAGEVASDRVREALASADLHLAPSWADTFNFAVVEAALVGTPSLVSPNVGAAPWLGAAVRVVAGEDGIAWANAVSSAPTFGEDERRRIADELSVASIAKRLEALYAGSNGA